MSVVMVELGNAVSPLAGPAVLTRLLSVLLLIGINAFFVTAEFAIVSVRRSRINQLAAVGDAQAKTVQSLQRSIERLLSTTQLGITLSSLALGWIGESTMALPLSQWLGQLPINAAIAEMLSHSAAVPLSFFLIAYLQIVLGELCPKSVALLYPEQLARFLGPPSITIARLFNPFIWALNQSTQLLLRLIGVQYTGQGWHTRVTPEELQMIINTSTESPGLEEEERELLNNVFEFREVTAGAVMVPRTSIAAIHKDATFQELLNEIASTGHSRYPVMGDSLDDIHGIVYFKELAAPLARGVLSVDHPISNWIRPARFVPEYMPLNELLLLMQRSGQAMVMVIDEFGGTAGLVSIKDLTAEIIGDSQEDLDAAAIGMQVVDENTVLVQAQADLETLNERLDVALPLTENYQTLAGFLIAQLQKIPTAGEQLHYQGLELTVVAAEGPRIHQVRIYRLPNPPTTAADGPETGTEAAAPDRQDQNE